MDQNEVQYYRDLKTRYPNLDQDEMRKYWTLTMKIEGKRANPVFKGVSLQDFLKRGGRI